MGGKDEHGSQLAKGARNDGVSVHFLEDEKAATGTCAVLIRDKERSLVANLSAAENYKISHLNGCSVWKNSRIYYSAGYFLTVSPDSMGQMAKFANETDSLYCLNLSAPFIISSFATPMMELMPFVDILFGNESEALAFGKHHKYENLFNDNVKYIKDIASKISNLSKTGKCSRIVIITQGPNNVIVADGGKVLEFAVPKVENIVDTNGAGDAFVGGFLAAKSRGLHLGKCVEAGIYAASVILQVSGTKLTNAPKFGLEKEGIEKEEAKKKDETEEKVQETKEPVKVEEPAKVEETKEQKKLKRKADEIDVHVTQPQKKREKLEKDEAEEMKGMEEQGTSSFGELPSGLNVKTPMGIGVVSTPARPDGIMEVQLPWAKVFADSNVVTSIIEDQSLVQEKSMGTGMKRKAEEIDEGNTANAKKKKENTLSQSLNFLSGLK